MATHTNTGVQTPAKPVTSGSLRPHWCIQREDNTVVPLIAIDELPDSVVLKDVPTTLTVLEALKARMELITGDHPAHGVRYQLDQPIKTLASDRGNDSGSDGSRSSEGTESSAQKGFTAPDKNKNTKEQALRHSTLTANDTSIIDPMAKNGTMGKKIYCTYWIQTGNCNYMQAGCKYKHEIPKDEETRRAIGFREFPTWPREELPFQPKPASAIHKPWRRQDGKAEFPGTASPANHRVTSPAAAAAHVPPKNLAHRNSHASAGISPQGPTTTPQFNPPQGPATTTQFNSPQGPTTTKQFNPNAMAFSAPHQHFPNHNNHMAQQRPFSQVSQSFLGNGAAENTPENYQQRPAQNNISPSLYNQSTSHIVNDSRTGSSSPPKQPPISRPTNLGQSSVVGEQKKTAGPTRSVAPDHYVLNRAHGASGTGVSSSQPPINPTPGSGYHNNWNPHTNAPTSMDISFIAPSGSTRSGGQVMYTPPTPSASNAFSSMNGNATSNSRAGTPAHYKRNAFTNNGNVPIKGRGPAQFGRNSPAPSTSSARKNSLQPSLIAEESDNTSVMSPPVMHRAMFLEPGQPQFVSNPPEPKKAAQKKHAKKPHAAKGDKSAKNKMTGNGYDVLGDMHDHQ